MAQIIEKVFCFFLFNVFGEHWALDREDWLEDCLREFLVFTQLQHSEDCYLICQLPLPTQSLKWQGILMYLPSPTPPPPPRLDSWFFPQVAGCPCILIRGQALGPALPACLSQRGSAQGRWSLLKSESIWRQIPQITNLILEKIIPSFSEVIAFKADQDTIFRTFFFSLLMKSWFPDKGLSPWPCSGSLKS